MKYVFIKDGVVKDIARVDPFRIFQEAYAAQFIEAPDGVEGGWLYDGDSFAAPAVAPVYPRLFVRDFLALFTPQEKLTVKAATRVSDEVGLWYDEMLAAQYITAEDQDTIAGLDALVSAGLLTAARHDEIIAAMQPAIGKQPVAPV